MFYVLTVCSQAEKKTTQYAVAKNLFIHLFAYPTNIYEAFIKLFLYTKHCAMWHKAVFCRNSYDQYFDSKETIKKRKYSSVYSFQYFMLRETHYMCTYLSNYLILIKTKYMHSRYFVTKNKSRVYSDIYIQLTNEMNFCLGLNLIQDSNKHFWVHLCNDKDICNLKLDTIYLQYIILSYLREKNIMIQLIKTKCFYLFPTSIMWTQVRRLFYEKSKQFLIFPVKPSICHDSLALIELDRSISFPPFTI